MTNSLHPEDRELFAKAVAAAIQEHMTVLTAEEIIAIRLLIKKQEQSIALRQAIIEKSLTSLVWSGVVGLGFILLSWATQHGYKP
jgi:hypothetical protein